MPNATSRVQRPRDPATSAAVDARCRGRSAYPALEVLTKMQTLSRYLMAALCMLATGTWILPVHTLAAPVPMPVSHGGDDGEVAVEATSAVAVESVEDVVLLPKQVSPCEPVPAEEFFVVIASQAVPEDAIAPLGVSDLGPVDSSAVAPLQIRVGLCSVAVAFVREGETTMRFG